MYCPSCGMEIDDNSKFCSTCGERITDNLNDMGIRYKRGDQNAFQEIYDDTVSWVRSYVYNRVSANNVEDCMQSIYIKLFNNISKFDETKGTFRTWFNTLVSNETIDFLRKYEKPQSKNVDSLYDDEDKVIDIVDPGMSPEDVMEKQEIARIMSEILSEISEEQRKCIMLRYMEGLKNKEIADIMGISEGTVKSRISYGLKRVEAKVIELEKQGTKLYSMAPLPFFVWLICRGNVAGLTISGNLQMNVTMSTMGVAANMSTGVAANFSADSGTVTTAINDGVSLGAGVTSGAVSSGIKGVILKIAIGASVGAVLIGGGVGIKHLAEKNRKPDIETETSTEEPNTEMLATDTDAVNVGVATTTDATTTDAIQSADWIDKYMETVIEETSDENHMLGGVELFDVDSDGIPEMELYAASTGAGTGEAGLYVLSDDEVLCTDFYDLNMYQAAYINESIQKGIVQTLWLDADAPYEFVIFKKEGDAIVEDCRVWFGDYKFVGVVGEYDSSAMNCYKMEYIDGNREKNIISYDEAKALVSDFIFVDSFEAVEKDVGGFLYYQKQLEFSFKEDMTKPCSYDFEYGQEIDYEALRQWMYEYYLDKSGLSNSVDISNSVNDLNPGEKMKAEAIEPDTTDPVMLKYMEIIKGVCEESVWPDGSEVIEFEPGSAANSQYGVLDIDGDGRKELVISHTETYSVGMLLRIYDYNPETDMLTMQLNTMPIISAYNNGIIKAYSKYEDSYVLFVYDEQTDTYVEDSDNGSIGDGELLEHLAEPMGNVLK